MKSRIRTLLPVGILLAHASSSAFGAVPQEIASSFEASLAASRARAGDVYVNGTANVLLEPATITRADSSTNAVAPSVAATFLDAAKGLQRVNVVVESTTRTVLETDATRREVDIAPVMTEKQFNESKASMPLGAVVIRNTSDIRPVSVVRTINVADVVIRPRG